MRVISSTPDAVWLAGLVLSVLFGLSVGYARAWWFALLGLAALVALAIGSQFASNATFSGSEDMSWRIVLIAFVAPTIALGFLVGLGLGVVFRALDGRLRQGGGRSATPQI
jgi:hypothetical protein